MCGECGEKETLNVMINVRQCIFTRHCHSLYLANHVKFGHFGRVTLCILQIMQNLSMERKVVFVSGICGLFNINVQN